ncbi:MAG: heavy metal transport/detoxification protein [Hydrocarboniphaga sp.]|uniref:heavy-metal-associated domain-containing protein n=1 Tax=Hydrocarboniphaga sp. TaxID=2033016 RepID=UPI002607781F|nr:heavy-metal-associated domain-containing protein [Hydrocarboniphaga sp.]MDB5969387.1 heavy metal transport/detoxification protein [Hydrocarboniphaga sp.]
MLDLEIKGMTCGHCVRAVTRAVQTLDPAATVAIDLPTGHARIETAQSTQAIATAIRAEGYEVNVV